MAEPQSRSIPSLVGDVIRETQDLVNKEITLFRTEFSQSVHQILVVVSLFIGMALFAVIALFVLLTSLVKGLGALLHSEPLAALIVGGFFAIVAISLAVWGGSKFALSQLEPNRTKRQVQKDADVFTGA